MSEQVDEFHIGDAVEMNVQIDYQIETVTGTIVRIQESQNPHHELEYSVECGEWVHVVQRHNLIRRLTPDDRGRHEVRIA